MDGRTFTIFNRYLGELRSEIEKAGKTVSADTFMVFLDKVRGLTPSQHLNDLIIGKLQNVDVMRLGAKDMLNSY
jgi:hypothetical protein